MLTNLPHDHGQNPKHVLEHMPSVEQCANTAEMFKLVGDGSRLRIFMLLCHLEECVSNISAAMEMTDPAVSHHLKLLKSANLITSRREGKEIFYKVADTEAAKLLHVACEQMFEIKCPLDQN